MCGPGQQATFHHLAFPSAPQQAKVLIFFITVPLPTTLDFDHQILELTKLSSPAGLAVLTLASHVSGQGSIPGGHR